MSATPSIDNASEVVAMFVSEARISANRRNAALSTGPRTPEGKERSRANALKHGLCSAVVVPESIELIQQRSIEFFESLKPQNELHVWMVNQAAVLSIRIDRCQRIERRVRDKASLRAELTWDDDRKFEAEVLGRSLGKDPAATVEALRRTPHGCEWLLTRWALLAYSADKHGVWTEDQTKLAFDLLATPHAFRTGNPAGVALDFEGRQIDPLADLAAVARREIADLKARREVVADLDEVERALNSSDLSNEGDPELRRLRRYESMLHGRFRYCVAQIRLQSPHRHPDPRLRPNWVINPETVPTPEADSEAEVADASAEAESIDPPLDLEPDETPEPSPEVDLPSVPSARRQKQARKAAAYRENRRKKVDRLRA